MSHLVFRLRLQFWNKDMDDPSQTKDVIKPRLSLVDVAGYAWVGF